MTMFKFILLFILVSISACGGGGSSDPITFQGKFIDSAVEGISYTSNVTDTQGNSTITSGVTDTQGNFSYLAGQTVTFSIGGITLGTVSGSSIITPVQLVTGATDETNSTVINIVQFLVTIDDDKDPSNGIKITPAIQTAAASLSLDFTTSGFDTDSNVSSVIGTLTTASTTGTQVLIAESTAQAHLSDSLFATMAGNYSGTYSGTDSGSWTVTVSTNGTVTGTGNSNAIGQFSISGSVSTSGTASVSTSGFAGGSSWAGTIDITNGNLAGSWAGGSDSGTFSGTKS